MGSNPLAEMLGRRLAGADAALEVLVIHRGAPGDRRAIGRGEIARVTGHALVLGDGTELPLHRVIEVREGGDVVWPRPSP